MLPTLPSAKAHHVHLDNSQRNAGKRNSSMIFRIEHLLPAAHPATDIADLHQQAAATTVAMQTDPNEYANELTGSAKRAKPSRSGGVYAPQFIPKNTTSELLATYALMSAGGGALEQQQPSRRCYCSLSKGVLCITPATLRKIKLSEDVHSYNALFEVNAGKLRVRIVRDIERDDEIVAWFDEEVTLLMSIPFLTPFNIQGNNRYICHLCQLIFETPNPLKLHLALGCGRHSMDIIYIRLHYALRASYSQQLLAASPELLILPTVSSALPPHATSSTSTIAPSASTPQPPQHRLRFSAFKPILPTTTITCSAEASISISSAPLLYTSAAAVAHSSALSFLPAAALQTPLPSTSANALNAAAQIEAIVSNMGVSKQGHLCIYCGKVYSRKYGLKIHIRTHTGFKPLKCKFCLRPFGDPSNLNKHVRLHLQSSAGVGGADGFKCHLCHKTLARRRDLQRHIESRHAASGMQQVPATSGKEG